MVCCIICASALATSYILIHVLSSYLNWVSMCGIIYVSHLLVLQEHVALHGAKVHELGFMVRIYHA